MEARWPVLQMVQTSPSVGTSCRRWGRSPTKTCTLPGMCRADHSVCCRTSRMSGAGPAERYRRQSSSSPTTGYEASRRPDRRRIRPRRPGIPPPRRSRSGTAGLDGLFGVSGLGQHQDERGAEGTTHPTIAAERSSSSTLIEPGT